MLIEHAHERSLGGALLWAVRADVVCLDVIVSSTEVSVAGALARRATHVVRPTRVSMVVGASSVVVDPTPVVTSGRPDVPDDLRHLVLNEGCDLVIEHGIARGEYLGLELARIVSSRLEVGVGRFDREMAAVMYAELDARASLATVAAEVRKRRVPGGERHPLMDLCRERWLRVHVVDQPELVGCHSLELIETTMDRPNLLDAHPAMAIDRTQDEAVLVCCTVGIDIDAAVMAADVAHVHNVERILVCSPAPLPASVVAVGTWMSIPPTFIDIPAPWL